ncbi:hypothetical protein MtrunA17_Chr3g0096741 [Medicago truncatula]|uniref:Transmembrane protein n=1 Tax=Medicago truncatula TaxID=3880 RepID=A0A396IMH1_MEDTR|nr:hypothetical protein MtrunA17_Chr3g0096741 [Medicago truncatula]
MQGITNEIEQYDYPAVKFVMMRLIKSYDIVCISFLSLFQTFLSMVY